MLRRKHSVTRVFLAVLVLTLATIPAALAKKKPPAHPININTAGAKSRNKIIRIAGDPEELMAKLGALLDQM